MERTFALIKNSIVCNVIVAEPEIATTITGYDLVVESTGKPASPGKYYDGGSYWTIEEAIEKGII